MQRFILVSLLAAASLFAQLPLVPGDSESWLQKGVEAYRSGQFQNAIEDFQSAADLDPNDVTAHLYLATANMVLYVPGVESKENLAHAEGARIEFKHALELDPGNLTALLSLGTLCLREAGDDGHADIAKLDEARSWYLKVLDSDPRNKNALYTIAVIDWRKVNPNLTGARFTLGMKPDQPGPVSDANLRGSLKAQYGSLIEEGISNLHKALEVDPAFEDAMSYLNLLIRQRADLAGSSAEYEKDIQEAGQWMQKVRDMSKANAQFKAPGNMRAAKLLTKVDPVYPSEARKAKVQGTVRFSAIIGTDGKLRNLQLVSGDTLLVTAALDAVKQWVYRPAIGNGKPLDVVTTVDVNFSLSQ